MKELLKYFLFSEKILAFILLIGSLWDLHSHKIPNWLTFPAATLALVYHTTMNGSSGFLFSLGGIGVGIAILLPFYLKGGMGAGDVKLLGAVGGFLGPKGVFLAFLFTALVGGIYALILMVSHGYLKKTILRYKTILSAFLLTRNFIYIPPPGNERKPRLWYGLAIALGTVLSWGFGRHIL
jgi:prepilin peptidase CpaA